MKKPKKHSSPSADSDVFAPVVEEYRRMEPDGADTWNPLVRDRELYHRMMLAEHLCRALRHGRDDLDEISRLRVLDVGCGNGRSTRIYLDFGLRPRQIVGVDLRFGALAAARAAHPSIGCLHAGAVLPLRDESIDWISLCTVVSSLDVDARTHLAAETTRVLTPGGRLFFFDRPTAHVFAGGGEIDAEVFPDLRLADRRDGWERLGEEEMPPLRSFLLVK